MTFTIRPMCLEDVPEVHALDKLCFSLPWPAQSFAYEVERNRVSRPWVVEWHGGQAQPRLAAMLVCWVVLDEVQIATIAVHPDFQQQEIARWLLAYGLVQAAQEGVDHAFLEVRAGNKRAQALYRQFGFEVVGVREKYYQDNGEDAHLMMLQPFDLKLLQAWSERKDDPGTRSDRRRDHDHS
jgi:ribosomal-protein-alanine N-acetyltransferase